MMLKLTQRNFLQNLLTYHNPFKLLNLSGTIALRHPGSISLFRMRLIVLFLKNNRPERSNVVQRISQSRRVGRKPDGAVVHFDLRKNEKRTSLEILHWLYLNCIWLISNPARLACGNYHILVDCLNHKIFRSTPSP